MLTLLYTLNSLENVKIIQNDTNLVGMVGNYHLFMSRSMQNLKHHQSVPLKNKGNKNVQIYQNIRHLMSKRKKEKSFPITNIFSSLPSHP